MGNVVSMPTPAVSSGGAVASSAGPGPRRPPLVRPGSERVLAGVAAGLARHLGLPVCWVRIGLLVSCLVGGFGALLYLWLWALVPSENGERGLVPPKDPARVPGVAAPGDASPPSAPSRGRRGAARTLPIRNDVLAGAGLLLLGLYLLAIRLGWGLQPRVVIPVLVVGAGSVLAFSQIDELERLGGLEPGGLRRRSAVFRLLGGALLVAVGVTLLVVQSTEDVAQMGRTLVAAMTVLGGTALVLAPWGIRLWRDLDAERASRVRVAERAEIAAHLHDSVLQTLALIQRRSGDPAEVTRLARGQERDLRAWLYGGPPPDAASLAAAVAAVAADVEDLHGVVVEVVTVGDAPLDERVVALVSALREAISNAVRHGAPPVRVYVEASPTGIEAFVRDRGNGFVLDDVPEHRRGLRDSVIARMQRHGGIATVRSEPGDGTEVRLTLPPEPSPGLAAGTGEPEGAQQ
jgi:signal transduction histidine kinase/phage shock protein PspC (stress-responsive transcriptional regulator)